MVDITANATVYPSTNDIAEVVDEGRVGSEKTHTEYAQLWMQSHIVSGFQLPATDPDLTITIPSGEAVIEGQRIQISQTTDITLADDTTNHIYLQTLLDGQGDVEFVSIVSNTTGVDPVNSVKIGQAITVAGAITSTISGDRERSPYTPAGGLELIETKLITSPVTGLTFLNLFGDRDIVYKLIAHIVNSSAAGANLIEIRPNGITTNQRVGNMTGFGGVIGGGTGAMQLGSIAALDESIFIDATINAKSGQNRHVNSFWNNPSGVVRGDVTVSSWGVDQTTKITSLEIVGTKANGMVDGFISLYRVRQ